MDNLGARVVKAIAEHKTAIDNTGALVKEIAKAYKDLHDEYTRVHAAYISVADEYAHLYKTGKLKRILKETDSSEVSKRCSESIEEFMKTITEDSLKAGFFKVMKNYTDLINHYKDEAEYFAQEYQELKEQTNGK